MPNIYLCWIMLELIRGLLTFASEVIVSEKIIQETAKHNYGRCKIIRCALPTGAGMVLNQAKPGNENIIAIIGLGGIGLSALIAANAIEVKQIIAIDKDQKN